MKRTAFALIALAVATVTQAQTVSGKYISFASGGNGTMSLDGRNITAGVGKLTFDFTLPGGMTRRLNSFCADLTSTLDGNGHNYTVGLTPDDNSPFGRAGKIVATYFDVADTAAKAQGLQLAVWEALYDNGATFGLSGRFQPVSGFGNANDSGSALSFASQYYGATSGRSVLLSTGANGGQSQMTPVPEPASMAALALGGIGLLRRRRAKRS